MKIINMEILTESFTPHKEFMEESEKDRQQLTDRIEEIRTEMASIVRASESLILDDATKNSYVMKFQNLQKEAMSLEEKFRTETLSQHQERYEKVMMELGEHVEEFAKKSDYDIVIPSQNTIYYKKDLDVTKEVIQFLQTKNLYTQPINEHDAGN
jgi:Skp family chaperone for outer membrane proteins